MEKFTSVGVLGEVIYVMTPHEQEIVHNAQVALAYEGKGFKSNTIQAILRDLNDREFSQVKNCHTFAEIIAKVGDIKSKRKAA